MGKASQFSLARIVMYVVLIAFTVLTIGPLLWLFFSSLKSNTEIVTNAFALPKKIALDNFFQAWKLGNLGVYLVNSIIYALISSVAIVYIAMSIGYALNMFTYKISKIIYSAFLIGLLVTVHAILVPLFLLESAIGIDDTYIGVILPYIAFGLPFMVYLAYSFIKGLPYALVESALVDGANHFSILHKIIIPISKPIVGTMMIFSFLANWNEFVFVFVLTSKESLKSLPVGINAFAGGMARDYGLLFATLVIGIIPILLFYALFYKHIVAGVAGGAMKE